MKNIRKIVAILAAVLMFCSVLPMGALSVSAAGDVIVDYNFDDGVAHFERGYVENGYMVFDATTADWQNAYLYANAMKANTNYVVTFKAKANKDAGLYIKINNNWAGDTYKSDNLSVSTEWQEYELTVNTGDLTSTALFMFYAEYPHNSAPIYCIDDLKIVEYVEPVAAGTLINGNFETGDETGWNLPQAGGVKAEAAHSGNYGMNVKGNGGWGGMLDQTFPVNAGNSYEISLWVKVIASGVNVQIKDGDTSGANLASDWVDMNKAGDWKQLTFIVTPTQDTLTINLCGGGNGNAEDVYVDDITVLEIKEPSFDGYIHNGDFETGKTDSWESVWGGAQLSMTEGRNGSTGLQVNCPGAWQLTRQQVNVEPNTNYVLSVYAKNVKGMTLIVKSYPADQNMAQASIAGGEDWTKTSLEFNSGDNTGVYVAVMSNNGGDYGTFDDFFMFEKKEASNDGYIINGTFETGDIAPWNNLWGSCPKAEVVSGGKDSAFALEIVSGQWKHVRQTNIAVEPNADYKITAWAKNTKGMSLLVKNGADSIDLKNAGIEAGDEWTEFVIEFNTGIDKDGNAVGPFDTIIFSLMGNGEEAYGTFDNIVMEKVEAPVCEHEFFNDCEGICLICGEEVRETSHNIVHVDAVAPTCTSMGNIEFWYCDACGVAYLDEACTLNTNMMAVKLPAAEHTYDNVCDADCNVCGTERTAPHSYLYACDKYCNECGEKTNPRAKHTIVHVEAKEATCQEYGNIEYWYCSDCNYVWSDEDCTMDSSMKAVITWADHDLGDAPECQDAVCATCGETIEGFGCISDAPICQDGTCIYCGEDVAATAECEYGEDGLCIYCGEEESTEVIYGDADGDGEVSPLDAILIQQFLAGWDVEGMDEISADADGDGEVSPLDAILIQQYLAGWDVEFGPEEEPNLFNDGELSQW